MPNLVTQNAEAMAWFDEAKAKHLRGGEFGKIESAVIWSDAKGSDGELLVPIDNPEDLIAEINANGWPLLEGHDPGRPAGRVLAAAGFTNPDSTKFIVALIGFYQGKSPLGFQNLGVESAPPVASPPRLPVLPDYCGIKVGYDPRATDTAWITQILDIAPLQVERKVFSYNAAEPVLELIRITLPYMALVWNPFVTVIATEAAKDVYAGLKGWVRTVLGKFAERQNPVLEVQSYHDGCHVSFIFRGTDVKRLYAAHDAHPLAAQQAATLVTNMNKAGVPAKEIVYEFHKDDNLWFPSYAVLHDGRFVTDNSLLIAVEKVPSGLSLGIELGS